jgi:hypothetical protein
MIDKFVPNSSGVVNVLDNAGFGARSFGVLAPNYSLWPDSFSNLAERRDSKGRLRKEDLKKLEDFLQHDPPSWIVNTIKTILGAIAGGALGNLAGIGADIIAGNQNIGSNTNNQQASLLPFIGLLEGGGVGALLSYLLWKPDNKRIEKEKNLLAQSKLYRQNKLSPEDRNKFEREVEKVLADYDARPKKWNYGDLAIALPLILAGAVSLYSLRRFMREKTRLPILSDKG